MSSKNRLQLYADECFPLPSVTYLKSLGYSIIHAFEKKNIKKKDSFHLAESKKLERILITLDRDFLYYSQADLKNHPGVIIISSGSVASPNVNDVCNKAFKHLTSNYIKQSLVMITRDKITRTRKGVKSEKEL